MRSTGNHKCSIPGDILDDLCSRFIINIPAEDRGDLNFLCTQIEQAHWFYLDYYATDESNHLSSITIREFATHIFHHVPDLRLHVSSLDAVLTYWQGHKSTNPKFGAILLDTDLTHVLLVQSYWSKASWGFPKGKVEDEDEKPWRCAVREVLEETGFDISKLINKKDFIEAVIHNQLLRLYIIGYIPRENKFQPRTRNEIKACQWFPLADLPSDKKNMTPSIKSGLSPNAFFMVIPFVNRIRRWISERNSKTFEIFMKTLNKSICEIEVTADYMNKTMSQGFQNEITDYNTSKISEYEHHSYSLCDNHKSHENQCSCHNPTQVKQDHGNPSATIIGHQSVQTSYPYYNYDFIAPSWANFTFDRRAIYDCLD